MLVLPRIVISCYPTGSEKAAVLAGLKRDKISHIKIVWFLVDSAVVWGSQSTSGFSGVLVSGLRSGCWCAGGFGCGRLVKLP